MSNAQVEIENANAFFHTNLRPAKARATTPSRARTPTKVRPTTPVRTTTPRRGRVDPEEPVTNRRSTRLSISSVLPNSEEKPKKTVREKIPKKKIHHESPPAHEDEDQVQEEKEVPPQSPERIGTAPAPAEITSPAVKPASQDAITPTHIRQESTNVQVTEDFCEGMSSVYIVAMFIAVAAILVVLPYTIYAK